MTASPHDPHSGGADQQYGSDGNECFQHDDNIWVLMLRLAQRLKVPDDQPRHHTEDHNQHKGNHGGLSAEYQCYDEALQSDYGDYAHDGKHEDI